MIAVEEVASIAPASRVANGTAVPQSRRSHPNKAVEKSRAASVSKPTKSLSLEQLIGAIQGPITKVPLKPQYRLGLLLAAALMILLPLIYVGIILATAYGVYFHAINSFDPIFSSIRSGRAAIAGILLYAAPLVMGTLLVLFMIKPVFARPAKADKGRSLTRAGEPKLFAFIDALCESVHAPVPKRIDVNCDVNASASFRRGMLSMFGNDLVLTIGMPLVSGLNARELAGVLAHEFGHFSQGFGMRLSYIVRSINFWFVRVVYQRDKGDELLESWSQGVDLRIGIILYAARGLIWLNRTLLWCLMMLGHIVCSYLMREMEYDADLHECRFAEHLSGSKTPLSGGLWQRCCRGSKAGGTVPVSLRPLCGFALLYVPSCREGGGLPTHRQK